MRIKVVQTPGVDEIDGIDLKRFVVGQKLEVGTEIGGLLLAEGWAVPVGDDEPAWAIPFSDSDPFMPRVVDRNSPPNLTRETYPPYVDTLAVAADFPRRKGRRLKE
jgi:hypothetical protein